MKYLEDKKILRNVTYGGKKRFVLCIYGCWIITKSQKLVTSSSPPLFGVVTEWLLTIIKWIEDERWDCSIKDDFIKKSLPKFVVTLSISNCFVVIVCYVDLSYYWTKNIVTRCEIKLRCHSIKIAVNTKVVSKCIADTDSSS